MQNHKLQITPAAFKDLKKISAYSKKVWGEKQRAKYMAQIDSGLKRITERPEIGRPRPDIKKGYLVLSVGSHFIVYKLVEDEIFVLGVPHQSMEMQNRFGMDSPQQLLKKATDLFLLIHKVNF